MLISLILSWWTLRFGTRNRDSSSFLIKNLLSFNSCICKGNQRFASYWLCYTFSCGSWLPMTKLMFSDMFSLLFRVGLLIKLFCQDSLASFIDFSSCSCRIRSFNLSVLSSLHYPPSSVLAICHIDVFALEETCHGFKCNKVAAFSLY